MLDHAQSCRDMNVATHDIVVSSWKCAGCLIRYKAMIITAYGPTHLVLNELVWSKGTGKLNSDTCTMYCCIHISVDAAHLSSH